jgi:hypothetical protein
MQVENIKLFQRLTNIYFASLKLNKSNHIVKVFGKIHSFIITVNPNGKQSIHSFIITVNPNGKQSISQITFQILVISVQLYDFSLACKSRYTIQENKSPVNR